MLPQHGKLFVTMSRTHWSCCEDRRQFTNCENLFTGVAVKLLEHEVERYSQNQDMQSRNSENPYLLILYGVALERERLFYRITQVIEDENIEFGITKKIGDFSNAECHMYFRMFKADLMIVSQQLWPRLSPFLNSIDENRIVTQNRYVAPFETCLCVYMFKMSHPCRLRFDTEKFFGMRKSKISELILFFGSALYKLACQYFDNPRIWYRHMARYARCIERKCNDLFPNIWGFIDGTLRKTCRPTVHQDLLYTRYKRCHALKYQSIVTPDGLIACLSGPYIGKRHDSRMLTESGILDKLRTLFAEQGVVYALYGDLAYAQNIYVFGGYNAPAPDSPEAVFNQVMSSVRISVEWGFSNVLQRWQHPDFQRAMKLFRTPIAQQYINCVFLNNIFNTVYGCSTSEYFECEMMTVESYLSLID